MPTQDLTLQIDTEHAECLLRAAADSMAAGNEVDTQALCLQIKDALGVRLVIAEVTPPVTKVQVTKPQTVTKHSNTGASIETLWEYEDL